MASPKILVIGSSGHQHVKCVDWINIDTVNIVDFDTVVVNTRPLTEDFLKTCDWRFFDNIRTSLSRLLKSPGEIITFGDKAHYVKISDYTSFSNYCWSPIRVDTEDECGDTVVIKTPKFPRYFEKLKSWEFYYHFYYYKDGLTDELKKICGEPGDRYKYHRDVEHFVENRYGKMLAGSIKLNTTHQEDKYSEKSKKILELGSLTVLPIISGIEPRQAINIILEDILSLPQEILPPEWVEAVPMPLVEQIQTIISEKELAIQAIEVEISGHKIEKAGLEIFKKLLYASGSELEQIFALCIEKLGAKILPAKYSDEEFVIEYKSAEYLVECKGIGKSIARAHVVQLLGYIAKYEENEGRAGKGILLGNAWRDTPPADRVHPAFPDNVIASAISNDIALVSSVDFFQAFCSFLQGDKTGEEILDTIVGAVGVVEFEKAIAVSA